jgi:protein-S-isoprenylcysteine O-methyltransferase Ste14
MTGGSWDTARLIILEVCWGTFGLVWAAGAIYNYYRAPAVRRRSTIINVWLVGLSLALLVVIGLILPRGLWALLRLDTPWLFLLGAALLVASTVFILWARWVLGTMWTASAVAKEGHELRTRGPYAITRHPIYTGLLGMLLGTALLSGLGIWAAYVLVGVVIIEVKIAAEERLMRETFGEGYAEYKRRVPQLIPGVRWPDGGR